VRRNSASPFDMLEECTEFDEPHLLSLVSSVGRKNAEGLYVPDEQCAETLQDIQKFLRQDASVEQKVACQLLAWNFVSKDLLPILRHHSANDELVIHVVKLIIFLTLPIDASSQTANVQQSQQVLATDAILDDFTATRVIFAVLISPLIDFERGVIQPKTLKRAELVVTFVRNVVLASVQKVYGLDANISVREERMINWFNQCSVVDIFVIAQELEDKAFRDISFLFAEIISCMCTCCTGKCISQSCTLHIINGVDKKASMIPNTPSPWRLPPVRQSSRFQSRFRYDALRVECKTVRRGVQKAAERKKEATCGSHESTSSLVKFMNTIEELYLSRIIYCSWKHLNDVRDLHSADEHTVRIYDLLNVLTYFMNYSSKQTPSIAIRTLESTPFAKVLSKPFVHWLKVCWEMFGTEGDTYGTSIMQSFLHAFMPLLERTIRSSDAQVKSAGLALASELVGAKNESALSHYLAKSLKATTLHSTDTDRILENVYHASLLKSLLRSNRPGKSYADSRMVVHCGFNRVLIDRILFESTRIDAKPRATLHVLQAMKLNNPCSFRNFDMLLCYTELVGAMKQCLSTEMQVHNFIRDEVHFVIKSLLGDGVHGSSFLNVIFTKNTTLTI